MRTQRLSVVCLAVMAVLTFVVQTQAEITVDYTNLGPSFQTAALNSGGVTVTGSNLVNVLQGNGLGIVGGISDLDVN